MSNSMQRAGWLPAPDTFPQAMDMAQQLAASAMVPTTYRGKPLDILIVADFAARVGLPLLTALQGVTVINGKPTLWGDCMLAVAQAHPGWRGMAERMEGTGDQLRAVCTVRRDGRDDVTCEFSVEMAKRARLWGKLGPWQSYPARMLSMRARAWAVRAAFADALQGIGSADELADVELAEGRPMPQPDSAVIDAPVRYAGPPAPASDVEDVTPRPRRGRPPGSRNGTGKRRRRQPVVVEAVPEPSAPLPGQRPLPDADASVNWAERMASAPSVEALAIIGRAVSDAVRDGPELGRLRRLYAERQQQLVPAMPDARPAGDAAGLEDLRRRQAERGNG